MINISFLVIKFDLNFKRFKIDYLNLLLDYKIFSYIFFIFCLLIVTNGTNFIDGLNGLVIGYYTIVLVTLFHLGLIDQIGDSRQIILNYLILLSFLFFSIFLISYIWEILDPTLSVLFFWFITYFSL